jgi:hypothetical protein
MGLRNSDLRETFHPFLSLRIVQVKMILRASPTGSFTMRHSLSQIIVLFVSGSVGDHCKPGIVGFSVAANAAQDAAIFFASACASGVFPVPCSHRLVLSIAKIRIGFQINYINRAPNLACSHVKLVE